MRSPAVPQDLDLYCTGRLGPEIGLSADGGKQMWTGDAIYGVEFPPVLVYQPAKTSLADDQTISRRPGHGNCPERSGYVQFALMIP